LDVSTATRSSPVGASCDFASGDGPGLAQPASAAAQTAATMVFISNLIRVNGAILAL
jgi:hypothetical protein